MSKDLKITITITGKAGGNSALPSIEFDPPLDGSGLYDRSAVGTLALRAMEVIHPKFVREMMGPVEPEHTGTA